MTNIKKYLKIFTISILSILLTQFILILLYYFDILSSNTYNIVKIILLIATLFFNSLILGKKAESKGYLEGIKFSLFIIISFTILSLLTSTTISSKTFLYFLIITITNILGGMIGINKKEL